MRGGGAGRSSAGRIAALVVAALVGLETTARAEEPQSRSVDTPAAVAWGAAEPEPSSEPSPQSSARETAPPPPRPTAVRDTIDVAVGLSPDAPGSARETELLEALFASAKASVDPQTKVRRLRPGTGTGREICRQRRDDLVVLIGYVPDRPDPVVLPYDCRLDRALQLRAVTSVDQPALIEVLWDEHDELIRQGVRERRQRRPLGRKARVILAAGVALVVIGVAAGVLIASALRDEKVVLKVGP